MIAANLKTIFLLSKHVVPHMIAGGGGAVVNMSSVQALATQRDVAAYTATKGAVISLTRVMAVDHGNDKIRVTAICPGTIETPLARLGRGHVHPGRPAKAIRDLGRQACAQPGRPADRGGAGSRPSSCRTTSFITGSYHPGRRSCGDAVELTDDQGPARPHHPPPVRAADRGAGRGAIRRSNRLPHRCDERTRGAQPPHPSRCRPSARASPALP